MLFGVFVLESDDLEALAANLAPIDGALPHKVVGLFVHVRVILHTGTHANDEPP